MSKKIIRYKWPNLRRLFKYSRFFTLPFSKQKIAKYSKMGCEHTPIFMIGAPRSGTTLIYQLITNYFNILYPSNLVELSHENIYLGFWLHNQFFNSKAHNCFKSFYGLTEDGGLIAPNEKGKFWWEWIPKSQVSAGEIEKNVSNEVSDTINSLMNRYDKPVIFKHLTLGLQIPFVLETFPNAKFVFVKRQPLYTIQSLYKEVLLMGDNMFKWVGVWPTGYEKLTDKPRIEKITKYIHLVYMNLIENIKLIDKKNIVIVDYDNLSENYDNLFTRISNMFEREINRRKDSSFPEIKISANSKVTVEEFDSIENEVNNLSWSFYESLNVK